MSNEKNTSQPSQPKTIYDALPDKTSGDCKPAQISGRSLYNKPISHKNGELTGRSRNAGDTPAETRKIIINLIIDEAIRRGHNYRDIAYLLLIARVESGFNPDTASCSTSAAGVMQITKDTATDVAELTAKPSWVRLYPVDANIDVVKDEDRFNAKKNILAGIIQFERAKARAIIRAGSDQPKDFEPIVYQYYHGGLYFDAKPVNKKLVRDYTKVDHYAVNTFNTEIAPYFQQVETALQTRTKFAVKLTQSNGAPYPNVRYVAIVAKKPEPSRWDRIFGYLSHLFHHNSAPAPAPTSAAIKPTPSVAPKPVAPAAKPALAIAYPPRVKDGGPVQVIQGKTDANGMTKEIPVEGASEMYLCVIPLDYEAQVKQLDKQQEEGLGSQSTVQSTTNSSNTAAAPATTASTAEAIPALSESSEKPSSPAEDNKPAASEAIASAISTTVAHHEAPEPPEHLVKQPQTSLKDRYCHPVGEANLVAKAFDKEGIPYRTELIEHVRSYVVKPTAPAAKIYPDIKNDNKPTVDTMKASVTKPQMKEATKPVATVTTAATNPGKQVTGKECTAGRDITDKEGWKIVAQAANWEGTKYLSVGAGSKNQIGGDCSGTTCYIYTEAGFPYPYKRTADFQGYAAQTGRFRKLDLTKDTLQAGDVLWWSGHMAIYAPFPPDHPKYKATHTDKKGREFTMINNMWTAHNSNSTEPYGPYNYKKFRSDTPIAYRYVIKSGDKKCD